jgi:hypothetical protein
LIAIVAVLSLSACASLTPKGTTVRLTTNPDLVKGCQYVGEVQGTDRMWGGLAGQGVAEDNAETRLRNKAAAMGADTVFLNISSTTTSGSKQKGEAYRCADLAKAPDEGKSKGSAMTECLKSAGIEGYYRVTSSGVPATSVQGRSGDGMLGAGFFVESRATIRISPDGQEETEAESALGSFIKGELVRAEISEQVRAEIKELVLTSVKMPPAIVIRSAFKHNVTRGRGAFRHESPEVVRLDITGKHFDVPCDALKRAFAKSFEKVDEAAVANWEKTHPEIASGVIVPSIREGMTLGEVEALFGAPERRAEVSGKTIYFYPKMKVTFTAGKVSAVE